MGRIQEFTLLKRRSDLTRAQFNEHWRTVHGPLLASLPDFWSNHESYIQNHVLPMPPFLRAEPFFDGIAQTMRRLRQDATGGFVDATACPDIVRTDELTFLSWADGARIAGKPVIIKDGPRTGVKLMSFVRPAQGFSHDTFLDYWHHHHAPLVVQTSPFWRHVRRYVQNHGIPTLSRSTGPDETIYALSGVAEIWFDSMEDLERAFSEPEYLARVRPDEEVFLMKTGLRFITQEFEILARNE